MKKAGGEERQAAHGRQEDEIVQKTSLCEITLTGTDHGEWQGTVYFPTENKQHSFQSLLELIRTVERHVEPDAGFPEETEQ